MMKFKIVLLPFPFDDLSSVKVRPAICLTDTISGYDHIIIAFITSQIHKANEETDILLNSNDLAFPQTGLKQDSAIRLHRLLTVPKRILIRELGELPLSHQTKIDN